MKKFNINNEKEKYTIAIFLMIKLYTFIDIGMQ